MDSAALCRRTLYSPSFLKIHVVQSPIGKAFLRDPVGREHALPKDLGQLAILPKLERRRDPESFELLPIEPCVPSAVLGVVEQGRGQVS